MLQAPTDYEHRLIQISGIVGRGYEGFGIADQHCSGEKTYGLLPMGGGIRLNYGGTKVPLDVLKSWGETPRSKPLVMDGIETHLVEDKELERFEALTFGRSYTDRTSVEATVIGRYYPTAL